MIGDHEDFPVEGMRPNFDNTILASFSHDEIIRFWDISVFDGEEDDGGDHVEDIDMDQVSGVVECDRTAQMAIGMSMTSRNDSENDDTGEDMSDGGDSDSDDDCSDDMGIQSSRRGRAKLPSASEKFFSDL